MKPVLQVTQQDEPHKLNPFSNNVGFTEPQLILRMGEDAVSKKDGVLEEYCAETVLPGIKIELEVVPSPSQDGGVVVSPHEETSASVKSGTSSHASSGHEFGPKIGSKVTGSDTMVTGHIRTPRPDSLCVPPKRRHSLQTIRGPTLQATLNEIPALSDLNLETTKNRDCSEVGDSRDRCTLHPAESVKPLLLRSQSGPPTTPVLYPAPHCLPSPLDSSTKPPGVERQQSCEENEIVVGTIGQKMQPKAGTLPHHSPSNFAVVISDTSQVEEMHQSVASVNVISGGEEVPAVLVHQASTGRAEAVLAPKTVVFQCGGSSEHAGSSKGSGSVEKSGCGSWVEFCDGHGSSNSGSCIASVSDEINETVRYQVHLLGHACNGRCYYQVCSNHKNAFPRF